MIKAEQAQRIMQQYEDDYDHFLGKLKAKRQAKKENAARANAAAQAADRNVAQAEARKQPVLKEKAKALLDKVGGIEGASSTAQNVMKYFKTDTPSDYSFSMGGSGEEKPKEEKKILGMPPMVVYIGGAVVLMAGLFVMSRMATKTTPQPAVQAIPQTTINPRNTPIA